MNDFSRLSQEAAAAAANLLLPSEGSDLVDVGVELDVELRGRLELRELLPSARVHLFFFFCWRGATVSKKSEGRNENVISYLLAGNMNWEFQNANQMINI